MNELINIFVAISLAAFIIASQARRNIWGWIISANLFSIALGIACIEETIFIFSIVLVSIIGMEICTI